MFFFFGGRWDESLIIDFLAFMMGVEKKNKLVGRGLFFFFSLCGLIVVLMKVKFFARYIRSSGSRAGCAVVGLLSGWAGGKGYRLKGLREAASHMPWVG